MNREASFDRSDTLVVVDRSGRRRTLIVAVVVLVVAAIALGMMMYARSHKAADSTAGTGKNGQIPVVTVIVPGESQVAGTVTASGALAALRDQPVGVAGAGGRVTAVLVDAGTWVRQGQVLATIDRSVQAQQAAQLAAQVEAARANLALAQSNYERSAALLSTGFVAKSDLDNKKATRDAAAAQVRVAIAQLGATRAQIGQLDIRAPTSGLVLSRAIEVGQIVSPASGALFRLAKDGDMEMQASLSQQDLSAIHAGMPATVTPLGSGRSYTGKVWQVAPVIDPQSRQGQVRIAIPYDPSIKPGGFADVKIAAGTTTAPLLPQSAVLSDEKGNYVYVVNAKNEVERRAIKLGTVTDSGVTIASGLDGTESVVLSAGPFLNPGQKIQPRRQAATS